MSLLVNGKLKENWLDSELEEGEFIRQDSQFRNWITVDGSPGPSGTGGFKAEPGRYHLYVSYACPWAHRTLIFRKLKKLEDIISYSVVHPFMGDKGWSFDKNFSGATGDENYQKAFMYELYQMSEPGYSGIVTVPALWDKKNKVIVNNESSEIIRMLNSAFDEWGDSSVDLYPEQLREAINAINTPIYNDVNNGVYKTGFAHSQKAYEKHCQKLFERLDNLETLLETQRYLAGTQVTEADWRLFTTLIRFDAVYFGHFKCNIRRIADYDNLFNYMLELYQWPGIAETVKLDHIKYHYYYSHGEINPTRIVPLGPDLDLDKKHNRDRFN